MPRHTAKTDDPNIFAKGVLDQIIAKHDPQAVAEEVKDSGKNPAAVALGRIGGRKGGKARAENLSAKKRAQIAKKAAKVRWKKL
jgi:hypothetical protein